jgi:hypothetical protein
MQWLFGEWKVTETYVGNPVMAGAPLLAVHSMQVLTAGSFMHAALLWATAFQHVVELQAHSQFD